MRKMMTIGLAALMLGLLSSCTDNLVPVEPVREQVQQGDLHTITASIESDETKTILSQLNVVWTAGDQIKVFNASCPAGKTYTLSGPGGTSTGTFTASDRITGEGPFYAVYPASAVSGSLESNSLVLTVPDTQPYAALGNGKGTFESGVNLAFAKLEGNNVNNLQFSNVGGLLKLTISGYAAVSKINVYSSTDEALNGTLTIGNLTGEPTFTFSGNNETKGFVSLECPGYGAIILGGADFYLFLPPGTLAGGFQVEIIDNQNKAMIQTAQANDKNVIERSVIRPMPAFEYVPAYNADFLTSTVLAGGFCHVDATLSNPVVCTETAGQYAYGSDATQRFTRIQNWSDGYVLTVTTPASLVPGEAVEAHFVAYGPIGSLSTSDATLRVVKKSGDRIWLVNESTKDGFIVR